MSFFDGNFGKSNCDIRFKNSDSDQSTTSQQSSRMRSYSASKFQSSMCKAYNEVHEMFGRRQKKQEQVNQSVWGPQKYWKPSEVFSPEDKIFGFYRRREELDEDNGFEEEGQLKVQDKLFRPEVPVPQNEELKVFDVPHDSTHFLSAEVRRGRDLVRKLNAQDRHRENNRKHSFKH